MKKVTIVENSPRKNKRRPIEIEEKEVKRIGTTVTAPNKQEQFPDFYEIDLSDEEERRDKKSKMSIRRKERNKTNKH